MAPYTLVLILIPLHELLIYPCLRNRGPSILQSAGIGAAALIVSSLYGVVTESIRPIITNGTTECTLLQKGHNPTAVEAGIEVPLNILLGLTAVFLNKCFAEFICAQAPYNMNGLFIGILVTLYILYSTLGTLWYEAWKNILHISTCGIWFYLTTL